MAGNDNLMLNKANLRDLIAVILLKLDLYRRLFSSCDLEI